MSEFTYYLHEMVAAILARFTQTHIGYSQKKKNCSTFDLIEPCQYLSSLSYSTIPIRFSHALHVSCFFFSQ